MKIITGKKGEKIAVLENDTHVSAWVEQSGKLCHDDCVGLFILPLIKPGDTVIDGGAFIGDHTCAYLEKVGPTGRVIAFEPNPAAFECLAYNCPKAENHNRGLGKRHRVAFLAPNPTAANKAFLVNAGATFIKDSPDGIADAVLVVPLDSFHFDKLNFIKLDLEGCEVQALLGARKTINQHRPVMVVECCDGHLKRQGSSADELKSLLALYRYKVTSLNPNLKLDEPQLDLLCEPL